MCFLFVVLASRDGLCQQSYREIVDPATGVSLSLPADLLGSATPTRWGTNWQSVDGLIKIDTLAYPAELGLRHLYDTLKGYKGRRQTTDRWAETAFTLGGKDADGSTFLVEARRNGANIRALSMTAAPHASSVDELSEHLSRTFQAFPKTAADAGTVRTSPRESTKGAMTASALTVQPNLGAIDSDGGLLFAPDGKYVAVGNREQVKLWETASGRPLRILEHSAFFERFIFVARGTQILSVHKDGRVRTWDPATGRMLSESAIPGIEEGTFFGSISYHPDQESVVIVADFGRKIIIWDWKNRRVSAALNFDTPQTEQPPAATDAVLSDDGREVIAAGDGMLKRFTLDGRQTLALTLRSDLAVLASGTLGRGVIVAKTKAERNCLAGIVLAIPTRSDIEYVAVDQAPGCPAKNESTADEGGTDAGAIQLVYNSPARRLYISRSGSGSTKIVDLSVLAQTPTSVPFIGEMQGEVLAVDQKGTLAALSDGKALRVVSAADGSLVSHMEGHGSDDMFAVASGDGRQIMLIEDKKGETDLSVWPVDGIAPTFSRVRLPSGYAARHAVPDSNVMLASDDTGHFIVLSILSGEQIGAFSVPNVSDIDIGRLSPDGEHAMLNVNLSAEPGSDEGQSVALLVKTRTGEIDHAFHQRKSKSSDSSFDTEMVRSFAFSADGKFVALGWLSGSIEIWTVSPPRLVKRLDAADDQTTSLTFSPDNKFIVGGSRDFGIFIWNVETGKMLGELERTSVAGHVSTGGVAISHNSMMVAAGPRQRATSSGDIGRERRVQVWDRSTKKLRFLLSGHEANVNAVTFTKDGRWIVSGSNDGTIRYWRRSTGKLGATFAVADGRWVIITDQGFFAASSNAGDLLSVVHGFQAVNIEQLWQSLYSPDLVREVLAGDPNGDVAKAAAAADLENILDSGPAPEVTLLRPRAGAVANSDLIEVEAGIRDKGKGVGRIEWRVNGITAAVAAKPEGEGDEFTISRPIALDPGDNVLEVEAYNRSNLLASTPARTTIKLNSTARILKPTLHVLVVGINSYIDKGAPDASGKVMAFPPLRLAVNDAKALADAFKQAGAGEYADVKVTEALDANATAAGLEAAIDRMSPEINPQGIGPR